MGEKAIRGKAITKVLSCFVVFVILMSAMPVSVFAVNDSNNSTGNTSNYSNETLLEKAFTENNSAEAIIPLFNNNTTGKYQVATWTKDDNSGGDCAPIPEANMPEIYLNDTIATVLPEVSNATRENVSALGCNVYVKIDDDTCVGYEVYVDGVYKLTEGEGGTPDGYCAFYVTAGTHTIEIRKNGCSVSITKNFQCGHTYRWVSMPDYWCECGDQEENREMKFRGTAQGDPFGCYSGGTCQDVSVTELISGGEIPDYVVVVLLNRAPKGYFDSSIQHGDKVEVYGKYSGSGCDISLNGEDYYIKKVEPSETLSINVWTDKSEYKIGETVTIYYQTNKKCTAKLTITKPDGGKVVYGPNEIPACTRSKSATAGYPVGKRTVVFEAWAGDEYKKATCYFDVVEEEKRNVKIKGKVTNILYPISFPPIYIIAIDEVIEDPLNKFHEGDDVSVSYPWDTSAEIDSGIAIGDNVEVYGAYYEDGYDITLIKSEHYLKKIEEKKPDLIIQDITWSPSNPKEGDDVKFTIIVKNQGKGRADESWLGFRFFPPKGIPVGSEVRLRCPPLDSGETASLYDTINLSTCGKYTFKATADARKDIKESREDNNEKTAIINIECPAKKPDLIIQDIIWSPSKPKEGDKVTFTVTVKNQGSGYAGTFYVYYYIDGSYEDYDYVPALSAGSDSTQTFTWTANKCGNVQVKAIVDVNNQVDEGNEGNNERIETVSIICPEEPDLTVANILLSKDNPVEGEPISIKATIKNIGGADVNKGFCVVFSQVSHYLNFELEETGCKAFIDKVTLSGLEAGTSTDVSVAWNAAPIFNIHPGSKIQVEVDQLEEIDEFNEFNNFDAKSVNVQSTSEGFYQKPHGYHFKNYKQSSSEIEHIKGLTKAIFNQIDLGPLDVLYAPFKILAIKWIDDKSEEGGHCHGMSATSILYYTKEVNKPVNKDTFDMLKSDNNVVANIDAYQAKQVSNILERIILNLVQPNTNIKEEYKKIKECIEDDKPPILSMNVYNMSGKCIGSHAIVAFNTFNVLNNVKNVIVYDNNYPGMARVVQFNFAENEIKYIYYLYDDKVIKGIHYDAGTKFYFKNPRSQEALAYSTDAIEKLGKLIWDFISAVIKNLFDEGSKLLIFECPVNVTITDQYGRIISDEGINEIPNARVEILDETKLFFVPTNLTYKVNISAYNFGNFTFTQISPITEEIASETGFMNISVNPSTKASVEIEPGARDYTMSIDYNGDGVTDEEKSPDVSETIEGEQPSVKPKAWLHSGYDLNNTRFYSYPSKTSVTNFDVVWTSPNKGKILTGDINSDGELELVSTFGERVYAMDKNGVLLWSNSVATDSGISGAKVNSMDLADMDGDNIPEVVVGISSAVPYPGVNKPLRILFYDGAGNLLKTISTPDSHVIDVKCADLNNDGSKEVIVTIQAWYTLKPRGVYVYDYNTGNELWHYNIGPQLWIDSIVDINNDGYKEIVVGTFAPHNGNSDHGTDDSHSYVFAFDKDGNNLWTKEIGWDSVYSSVADLNNDGNPEIISFRNQNEPYYPGANDVYILNPANGNVLDTYNGPANKGWSGWAIADINNDGKKEIAIGNRDGTLRVLDYNLNLIDSCSLSGTVQAVNDINGDGKLEIIVCTDDKRLVILDNEVNEIWRYKLGAKGNAIVSDLIPGGTNEIIVSADKLCILSGIEGSVPGDVTGNGRADYKDLSAVMMHLGEIDTIYDVDRSGKVGYTDLGFVVDHWTASKPYGRATTTVKGPVTVLLGSSFKVQIKTDGTVEAAHISVIFPSELKIESINPDPYDNIDFSNYQNGTNWVDVIVANDVDMGPIEAPTLAEIGFTATQEGTYTIDISSVINGEANDVEALTVGVVKAGGIDAIPPDITIISPEEGVTYATNEIALEVTANEAISKWSYNLNRAGNVTFTPNITIIAREGANSLVVFAEDMVGNICCSEVSFEVDTTV